jgi:hypothetical protein
MRRQSVITTASLALGIGISTVLATTFPASAFTYKFGADSESSNTPATGAAATVEFDFQDLGNNQVQIDLQIKNTTGEETFGVGATTSKLTGVAFDMFDNLNLVSSNLGTELDTLLEDVSFAPFSGTVGNFDFALADNNNFLGGNANGALAEGLTNNVSLVFDGLNGESVDAFRTRFEAALESETLNIAARFQQVNGSLSDKLLGGELISDTPDPDPTDDPVQTPEPGTLLGFGLLAGTLILGARKRSQCQASSLPLNSVG